MSRMPLVAAALGELPVLVTEGRVRGDAGAAKRARGIAIPRRHLGMEVAYALLAQREQPLPLLIRSRRRSRDLSRSPAE
jgi:hypothetical protein